MTEKKNSPLMGAVKRARANPVTGLLTPEQRAEADRRLEEIRSGKATLVEHEEREAWLATHRDPSDAAAE